MKKFEMKISKDGKDRVIFMDAISLSKAKELVNLRYGKGVELLSFVQL